MVYNPPSAHYSHIKVDDISDDIMEDVMGYKGAYFKAFTQTMKLRYVWWNKDTKVVELWGPHEHMLEAQFVMRNRLETLKRSDKSEVPIESIEHVIV